MDLINGLIVGDVCDAIDFGKGFFEEGIGAEEGLDVELEAKVDGPFLGSFAVGYLRVVEVGCSFGS